MSVIRYPGFSPKIHTIKNLIGEKQEFALLRSKEDENGRQRNACSDGRLTGQKTG